MSDSDLAARFEPALRRELAELDTILEQSATSVAPVALDQQSVGRLARMDAMQMQAIAQENERDLLVRCKRKANVPKPRQLSKMCQVAPSPTSGGRASSKLYHFTASQ